MKRYLSVKEICERLPVCKSLVYRLVRDGELPATRLGGKILVPEEDLAALLEAGEKRLGPEPPSPQKPPRGKGRRLELW
jgi:excisionase family DNA binding protein